MVKCKAIQQDCWAAQRKFEGHHENIDIPLSGRVVSHCTKSHTNFEK